MKAGIDYIAICTPFCCTDGQGKFLLHKRSANCRDEVGRWDIGAGQLEFGEQPQECVLREVKEEYGCTGTILEELSPISVVREENGEQSHWLACPFIVLVDPAEVENRDPEKIEEIAWFSLDELPEPLHTGFSWWYPQRKEVFEKYRK